MSQSRQGKTHHLIGFGKNDKCCLGSADSPNQQGYFSIQLPPEVRGIKKLIAGTVYSGFIDLDNNMYEFGQLSNKSALIETPTLCSFFTSNNLKVIDASCMNQHVAVITGNKKVYVWGDNTMKTLSNADQNIIESKNPLLVEFPQNVDSPVAVSCGGYFTMILFANGDVYAFGLNNENCLGVANPDRIVNKPEKVQSLRNIIQIAAGWSHACALNRNHVMYSWGRSSYGRLGHLKGNLISAVQINLTKPNDSDSNEEEQPPFIKSIFCSHTSSFAVSSDGQIYSCGWNQNGENGVGDRKSMRSMHQGVFDTSNLTISAQKRNQFRKKEIIEEVGGSGSCILLDDFGNAYVSGSNKNNIIGLGNEIQESITFSPILSFDHIKSVGIGSNHSLFLIES